MRALGLCILLPLILDGAVVGAQDARQLVVRANAAPCLTVRAQPKADAGPVGCIRPGTRITADSSVPFWRRVRLEDSTHGWAAKGFLDAPGAARTQTATGAIPDSAWLEIHIVDVGQGDGIWISTWDDGDATNGRFEGRNIVIDGGPDARDASNAFLKYIGAHAYEGAVIDAMLITHPHNDHYPGARGVLRHFEVCSYYDPDTPNGPDFERFIAEVRRAGCNGSPIAMHRGLANFGTPAWGSELQVDFLRGGPVAAGGPGSSAGTRLNDASVVMKLTYGAQSFLFMGDAEGKARSGSPDTPRYVEERLLADSATAAKLRATVLKVAHHGSETSSTLPFIRAVDPSVVIVSSGRRSFNGRFLPDRSVLERYCTYNPAIAIYRTDQDDAAEGRTAATDADGDHIVIRTNGQRTIVQAYENGKPFTAHGCTP